MTTSSYLEHFLSSLESLPGELRRNFALMHDLDGRNKAILREADAASDDYLRKVGELNSDRRRAEADKIQKMFRKAKSYGDDKVSIALLTYEMVDKHIRRLDADLAKFEAEMREKGRLSSQTETDEDERQEAEVAAPAPEGKKRGRKKGTSNANSKEGGGRNPRKPGAPSGGASGKGAASSSGATASPVVAEASKKKGRKSAGGVSAGADHAGTGAEAGGGGLQNLAIPSQEIIDMPVDPNEPTYCLCQQVSYGEMIGCDNNDCPIEWFHFGCMSLTTKPKGKWYCPKCQPLFKKKKGSAA